MISGRKPSEVIYISVHKKDNIASIQGGGPIFDKIPFKADNVRVNIELKMEEICDGLKHHILEMTPTLKNVGCNYKLSPKTRSTWQISSVGGDVGRMLSTYDGKKYEHISCIPIHTEFGDMCRFVIDLDDIPVNKDIRSKQDELSGMLCEISNNQIKMWNELIKVERQIENLEKILGAVE